MDLPFEKVGYEKSLRFANLWWNRDKHLAQMVVSLVGDESYGIKSEKNINQQLTLLAEKTWDPRLPKKNNKQ